MNRSQLPIPNPCCADWDAMTGNEHKRFCSDCEKDVVNLSTLTRAQALVFLRRTPNPCIRYTYDREGQVFFVDPQLQRQRTGLKKLLAAALVLPLGFGLAACDSPANPDVPQAVANPAKIAAEAPGASRPAIVQVDGVVRLDVPTHGGRRPLSHVVTFDPMAGEWGEADGELSSRAFTDEFPDEAFGDPSLIPSPTYDAIKNLDEDDLLYQMIHNPTPPPRSYP